MSSDYDATEFVDNDFQAHQLSRSAGGTASGQLLRAPTRDEVDGKVAAAQQKLAELKRAQEALERERAALEETRRRQHEFQTGRQEVIQNLTRGVGLLEKAEFDARRDAEQMAKPVADFRKALAQVEAIHEETWTKDNFEVELTRALTMLENARMEWNAARLKCPVLSSEGAEIIARDSAASATAAGLLERYSFGELCRIGFALTWPLAVVALLAFAALLVAVVRR